MFHFLILLFAFSFTMISSPSQNTPNQPLRYLALGDSYTIGEGVSEEDRYPNQLVKKLNETGKFSFSPAQIIAKTGWTVDELEAGIQAAETSVEGYDLVTLLIGVNNQYRGRPVDDYKKDFKAMLERAIAFARGKKEHVVVISIPDWGVTPFALSRNADQKKVAREIDAYNEAKKSICSQYGVSFVEITQDYRKIGALPEMVVEDQLHPSGLVYQRWTEKIFPIVQKMKF